LDDANAIDFIDMSYLSHVNDAGPEFSKVSTENIAQALVMVAASRSNSDGGGNALNNPDPTLKPKALRKSARIQQLFSIK
jgi:hypothetical protein